MARPQAFLIVGHAKWGKSRTLRALTEGVHQRRHVTIGGREFWIRRMSNDDLPRKWAHAVQGLEPGRRPYVILTVCPKPDALAVLETLRRGYDLYFWILRRCYSNERVITAEEVQALRALGAVEVFENKEDGVTRAVAFRQFIEHNP